MRIRKSGLCRRPSGKNNSSMKMCGSRKKKKSPKNNISRKSKTKTGKKRRIISQNHPKNRKTHCNTRSTKKLTKEKLFIKILIFRKLIFTIRSLLTTKKTTKKMLSKTHKSNSKENRKKIWRSC